MAHEAENRNETTPPRESANRPTSESQAGMRIPTPLELAGLISRLEESVDEIRRGLADVRGALGDSKTSVTSLQAEATDLAHRLEPVEAQLRALKRSAVSTERPSPVPEDPDHPTVAEARRIILDQLYKSEYWGGRHTSGEHFCRGYLAKSTRAWVREIVRRLVREGLLLPHGKSSDEHYSLNRAKANEIYDELGIAPRDTRAEAPVSKAGPFGDTSNGKGPREVDGVSQGTFQNTIGVLRERVESLEAGLAANAQETHRLEARIKDHAARLDNLEETERSRAAVVIPSPAVPEQTTTEGRAREPSTEEGA